MKTKQIPLGIFLILLIINLIPGLCIAVYELLIMTGLEPKLTYWALYKLGMGINLIIAALCVIWLSIVYLAVKNEKHF